ncbi:MAG: bifunctional adenosylcobinamide kinase/adenosylcobinamide-phosphate guanylyltransferase [Desulfobulbus sp.]|jgi:adenosylcobinamide kinase/adenosylcobinamide-phosphate guanylyltransferase|uniref:bifunctional adenosylcobinamide kinase/adenosylcobinamide-phosphate guanylyltransferase n=1 Tax=Desulfobulbus sp. TaxID=895 RepID=UPI00283EDBD6|nr:bifunctional adenosylcobinamide kinase/adenosylcobinamide-phosphate guanylyltransferase [Desulfobulbus sp.]MDR2549663.1 bifunctional adenosylcobinamide kinase/adenosylcobinamide-phosphate guanylyltransferase [Desulfobulbus sp.]
MGRILLVTGGARSGKSSFAERLVTGLGPDIAYIATAKALDEEMIDRIAQHRHQRPAAWHTHEAPDFPSQVIADQGQCCDGLLLDCLTVLTTNKILAQSVDWDHPAMARLKEVEAAVMVEIEAIVAAASASRADVVAVTNEVGCGIVPGSSMARFFRDCAGRVNQRMAAAAAEVYLVVSGIPVRIKG